MVGTVLKFLWFLFGLMVVVNIALIVRLRVLSLNNKVQVPEGELPTIDQIGTIKMIYRDDRLLVEMQGEQGSFDVVCEIYEFANGLPSTGDRVQVSSVCGRIVTVQQLAKTPSL